MYKCTKACTQPWTFTMIENALKCPDTRGCLPQLTKEVTWFSLILNIDNFPTSSTKSYTWLM